MQQPQLLLLYCYGLQYGQDVLCQVLLVHIGIKAVVGTACCPLSAAVTPP